ncbi:MAG TPA: radical SAM protein [Bacteroidales bacterium]|nr:radical SAM protein [Bacteroidales bacterium]
MSLFRNKIHPSFAPETMSGYFENTGLFKNSKICNAPYTGLYFTPEGLIKPCCAHADLYSYGCYPEVSIHDALTSVNRKLLQKHMNNNSLAFGCQPCLNNISSGNYRGSISSLYKKSSTGKYTEVIDFELSHFCNLNCIMCYLHTDVQADNEIYGDKFLEDIKPYLSDTLTSRFYGGEPFLINTYYRIWEFLAQNNPKCQVHIQTNGTVFNRNIESLLNKLNVFLGVSIDAISPSLYEKIRKGADYNKVMEHTRLFNEVMQSQGKSLTLSFCPMPLNWQEIPAIFEFADTLRCILFFNTVMYPVDFSFGYLHSTAIAKIANELERFKLQRSDNPHQSENFRNLQNFIRGLFALSEENGKIELEFQPMALHKFLAEFVILTGDKSLVSDLEDLMAPFDKNMAVSPYLQAHFKQLSRQERIFLINKIVKNKDIAYLKNIFHS